MITLLSSELEEKINQWLTKFPPDRKQSAVLYALRLVQEENGGFLTTECMDQVADYLEMPRSIAYEVASFYSLYYAKQPGRHAFSVCTNISCLLRGSEEILTHLKQRLGIQLGETSADGRYSLREVECLAACVGAPVLQVNDRDYYEHLTPEKIDALLVVLDQEGGCSNGQ